MSPKTEYRFVVDFMLGRLARRLRALGFDVVYVTAENRYARILSAQKENRVTLTRDTRLAGKSPGKLLLINNDHVAAQLRQVVEELRLDLSDARCFTRCTLCNEPVLPVENKREIRSLVPEHVYETNSEFTRCSGCGHIYWRGTHRTLLLRDMERAGIRCKTEPQKG